MNLRDELLREHSRAQAEKIAGWIGEDAGRFRTLIHLFLHDEYRIVQRAAYALSIVADRHPELVRPHLGQLVRRTEDPGQPAAVRRNVLRLLQAIPVPGHLHGPVMDIAFRLLESPEETVAVRVFSMTVLANLARIYPDIKGELRMIIEEVLAQGGATAGFRSRAAKVLKELDKR
jgi:hypothetical protein